MTNNKFKSIIDFLFCGVIFIFIIVSTLKSFFKPIKIIQNENRYANMYKMKNYLTGELQSNIESTLSDQIIYSSKMRKFNNLFDILIEKKIIDRGNFKDKYISLGSISLFNKNYLVYNPYKLTDYKDRLLNKSNQLNKIMELYPNVEYYYYYIEKDTDIDFTNNKKLNAFEYFKNNLNSVKISKFEINNFEEFSNFFYKTDHHWNFKGSYRGYLQVLNLLKINDSKKYKEEICINGKLIGSKGTSLGNLYYDSFCIYKFDYDDVDTIINGKKGKQYGHQSEYINGKRFDLSYGGFYGYDEGEIIFNTNNESKDNILIIGNSYDNAILKLLSEKFNKTVSIDLRNYEHYMKNKFNFQEYLNKFNINKVLFIGDISFYFSEEFNVIK